MISSFCTLGNCVEVGPAPEGGVFVRDGKDDTQSTLLFTATEWTAFVAGVKAGEFDIDVVHGSN